MNFKNKINRLKEQFAEDLPVIIASAISIGTALFLYNRIINTGLLIPKKDLDIMKNEGETGFYNKGNGDQYTVWYSGKAI